MTSVATERLCGYTSCSASLDGRHPTAVYCSPRCSARARRARDRELRDIVLAFLAAPAPPRPRRCHHCGERLAESQRKDARFCNSACRAKDHQERKSRERASDEASLGVAATPESTARDQQRRNEASTEGKLGHGQRRTFGLRDLSYVVRQFETDAITPCTYCGAPADSQDHALPRSYMAMFDGIDADIAEHMLIVVPACRECNSVANDKVFRTLREKALYLRERMVKRYRRVLEAPDWTEQQLATLGPTLRSQIARDQALKHDVKARLAWSRKFLRA